MSRFIAALLLLSCFARPLFAEKSPHPNILFFLVDDQRNDTLGCAGHPILKTPNVDRLAEQGVRFRNMFVTTSICAASRATIFTGLYERTHGYTFGTPPISKERVDASYPVLLRKHGYRTGFIGKFGVRIQGQINRNPKAKKSDSTPMFDYAYRMGHPAWKKQPDGSRRHMTQIVGDKALEFLDSQPNDKPFCLSVSFNAVHAVDGDKRPGSGHYPWPKVVDGMYDDVEIAKPRLSEPEVFESQPEFLKKSFNRTRFFWRWDTPKKYDTNMRAYFRMISGVDHVVGRIMEKVKQLGMSDNTVVIYTGDNGYYMGQRGFAGKWSHYEESLRVPLIIVDPRVPKKATGKVVDQVALNVDLPATMLTLAGVGLPKHYQGGSLTPFVSGQMPDKWRTDFFCEHLMNNGGIPKWEGIRGERYVYARYFQNDFEFLHDLKSDPDQLKNIVNDKEQAEVLARLRKRCNQLRDEYGGPYKPLSRK